MKEIVTFTASVPRDEAPSGWQGIAKEYLQPLSPAQIGVSPFGMVVEYVFNYYPHRLDEINVTLERFGITGHVHVRRLYEPEELLKSEFLELRAGLDVDSVAGTLTCNMDTVCPFCGFKETRWILPEIRIENAPRGYELAKVDYHPLVVSYLLAEEIRWAGCSGVELVPLEEGNAPDWYGLNVTDKLPPMQSPPTRVERPWATPFCEVNHNLGQTRSQLFYSRHGFDALDFNHTFEVFGDSEATARGLVVSNRVYRLLTELGVSQLVFEPVRFVD